MDTRASGTYKSNQTRTNPWGINSPSKVSSPGRTKTLSQPRQIEALRKINQYISDVSKNVKVLENCRQREAQLKKISKMYRSKNWNGIVNVNQISNEINTCATRLRSDFPSQTEVISVASKHRGLVGEMSELYSLSRRNRMFKTLQSTIGQTIPVAHKVRDL